MIEDASKNGQFMVFRRDHGPNDAIGTDDDVFTDTAAERRYVKRQGKWQLDVDFEIMREELAQLDKQRLRLVDAIEVAKAREERWRPFWLAVDTVWRVFSCLALVYFISHLGQRKVFDDKDFTHITVPVTFAAWGICWGVAAIAQACRKTIN